MSKVTKRTTAGTGPASEGVPLPGVPRAVKRVQRALRPSTEQDPADRGRGIDLAAENEALRAVARDLRHAAHENLQAALKAARLAEEAARSHREQLEHLDRSLAAYDAALSQITAPTTLND
jgi:hypothetical protein